MKWLSFIIVSHAGHRHSDHTRDTAAGLRWALALNVAFLVIEAGLGFATGSLALLADAAHMVNDVAALSIALLAAHLARRPPCGDRSYGYRRIEVVAGFVSSLLLLAAAVAITRTAITRLSAGGPDIPGAPVLVAGAVGLAINVGSAWYLFRAGGARNLNVRAALTHMLADALGSVAAVIAALFILAGFPAADAVLSLVTAALIAGVAAILVRDVLRVLMQFSPRHSPCDDIRSTLEAVPGVREVHELHVWSVDGDTSILTAHVVGHKVRRDIERQLADRYGITHTTIQEETTPCHTGSCVLFSDGKEWQPTVTCDPTGPTIDPPLTGT